MDRDVRMSLIKQNQVHVAARPADDTLTRTPREDGWPVAQAPLCSRVTLATLMARASEAARPRLGDEDTVTAAGCTGPTSSDEEDTRPAGVHAVSQPTRVPYTLVHTLQWFE